MTSVGRIDFPSQGAIVAAGTVRVLGWAVHRAAPVVAAFVHVVGTETLVAAEAVERPDVSGHFGDPALLGCGYLADVDLAPYAEQDGAELELEMFVLVNQLPGEGTGTPLLERLSSVTVRIGPPTNVPRGSMDAPPAGSTLDRGPVHLHGWATSDAAPVTRVEVIVDGTNVGPARLALPRPDVAHGEQAHLALCGYEHTVDISCVPSDATEVRLGVVAWAVAGAPVTISDRTFALAPPTTAERAAVEPSLPEASRRARVPADSETLDLVVFTHDLGYAGAQLWLDELLRRAGAGRDFPCTVVAIGPGPLAGEMRGRGIEVQVTQPYPHDDAAMYEGRLAEVSAWLAGRSHNAVLVNTFDVFLPADAASALGMPVVWAVHESWPPATIFAHRYPPGGVAPEVQAASLRALRGASALVFPADATRRLYEAAAAPGRTVVCAYGVDLAAIDAYCATTSKRDARRSTGLPDGARVLLVIGLTEPRKAQTLIAEAFSLVARDYPDALLVFVGATASPYAGALRRFLDDAGLAERSRVVPVVEDTHHWYRAADVLLSASDVESLPRSVLEAMCFGLPVAATEIFGLPEVLTDGETGYLFPPRDLAETVGALRRVLGATDAELAGIAAAAREVADDRCDSSGYAADVMVLLDGLRHDPAALPDELLRAAGRRHERPRAPAP